MIITLSRTGSTVCAVMMTAAAILASVGCANRGAVGVPQPTQFLRETGAAGSGRMKHVPFEMAWVSPNAEPSRYSKLVIRHVTNEYLRKSGWGASRSSYVPTEEAFVANASELARYFERELLVAFSSPDDRFQLASFENRPGTLILEVAITDIVFGRPRTETETGVSGAPSGGAKLRMPPTVEFEARVLDGGTGAVVAAALDRRSARLKVLDVNAQNFADANREICAEWASEMMRVFNHVWFSVPRDDRFRTF